MVGCYDEIHSGEKAIKTGRGTERHKKYTAINIVTEMKRKQLRGYGKAMKVQQLRS